MVDKRIAVLKDKSNVAIADRIRNNASMEYRNRIPEATQAGIEATLEALVSYRPHWNEFVDALVNRIGTVYARNISWTNPLAEFKRGMLSYGDTIEEIQVGLLESHLYDPDRDYMEKTLFGRELPEVQSNFHTVNRQEFYKVTVNDMLLRRAFLESGGLNSFVSQLMEAPSTSDQWDEFLLTTSLFETYESNGGFYHVNVPNAADLSSDATDARGALRKMRAMADTIKFPSTRYNAAGMPTFANPEDLLLFVTPEFNAAIDVEALAGAFNVDKADLHGRIVPIPKEHFRIDGAQAIMTTKDFFVIADTLLENTSQQNAANIHTNYFLHHHSIISASRFVPAVLFWDGQDDEVIEMTSSVISIATPTAEDRDGTVVSEVERGELYQLNAVVTTNPADAEGAAVVWSVEGATSSQTYATASGVLHVGGQERATTLKVKATSTWIDPENVRAPKIASSNKNLTVTGDLTPEWPVSGVVESIAVKGVEVEDLTPGTTAYTVAVPDGEAAVSDVAVVVDRGASATVTVSGDGTVVTIVVGNGTASTTTYTVTLTAAV